MSFTNRLKYLAGLLLTIAAVFSFNSANAQEDTLINLSAIDKNTLVQTKVFYIEDKSNSLRLQDIITSAEWRKEPKVGILNFGITESAYWIKLSVINETEESKWILKISQPILDEIHIYTPSGNGGFNEFIAGESFPFSIRPYPSTDYLCFIDIPVHTAKTIYLKVRNTDNLQVPIIIGTESNIIDSDKYKDIFWGVYIGLILSMLLYNFFIYTTVKDKSYLYYVIYLIAVLLTQASIQGYTFQYLWPDNKWIATHSTLLLFGFVGMTGMSFVRYFLHVKEKAPILNKGLLVFYTGYTVSIILGIADQHHLAFKIADITASLSAFYVLLIAIRINKTGYRPAKFFLIAWTTFLLGILISTLKDFNILPYNNFTLYMMPIGSAMEVILLSFALADRINILKKENETILKEQNITLERQVNEKTADLRVSNSNLVVAMDNLTVSMKELKEAQTQLVESEKMASLGQLTAGIAHEINNPINFVTSNVKPLRRDFDIMVGLFSQIEDISLSDMPADKKKNMIEELKQQCDFDYLKTEVDFLLNGITEGSTRTAEIVKGLRIFSRLDEDDLKRTDINEGMDSSLLIVNSLLESRIEVVKKYNDPVVAECYPGKLNQVFLNILTNAIYAVKDKFKSEKGGLITIEIKQDNDNAYVSIADNGTGMDEAIKKKLFEPFFTTKEVGQGTGLGLSIVWNTIKKHNGIINVNSTIGVGTTFEITIPLKQ